MTAMYIVKTVKTYISPEKCELLLLIQGHNNQE